MPASAHARTLVCGRASKGISDHTLFFVVAGERDFPMNQDETQRVPTPPDATSSEATSHHSVWRMNRRRFLVTGAATSALAGIENLAGGAHAQEATPANATPVNATPAGMEHMEVQGGSVDPLVHGLVHFSPPDAAIIDAAAERLIPADNNGPGAREAGVVFFIDRQLARESRGYTGPIYNHGPFASGEPTQGDQSGLPIPDRFRLGIAGLEGYANQLYSKRFVDCSADEQDRILTDLEKGTPDAFADPSSTTFPPTGLGSGQGSTTDAVGASEFFALLLEYVKAGFFADPIHGGNRDMVGWKLIGFPGAQMGYAELIDKHGQPFTGEFKSLADYQGEISGGA